MNIRELALSLLLEHESSDTYINLSLSSHKADSLSPEERSLLTLLLYTAVERKITYDYYIAALCGKSADKLLDRTRNILRLGLCQLLHIDNIPDFAAVNETVKLAKNPGERSFVNGVLRAAARNKDSLPMPQKEKNHARYYSVYYSLPLGIVKHFFSQIGEEESIKLFESFNSPLHTDVTVNTMKISVDDYFILLTEDGYTAELVDFSPITIRISGSVNPRKLRGFEDGLFFVQDSACALCATVLDPKPSELIIDTCSAPGGKSFATAILSSDSADIRSMDIHESKMSLITDGANRLGISSIKAVVRDATSPDSSLLEKADKVLCDVPCSGLGVIAKKPDLRYNCLESIKTLPPLQLEILTASAKYLKAGGTLVYSTCTLNRAENEEVVLEFLNNNPDFEAIDFTVGSISSVDGMLTTYPHVHSTDGFFISKLRKKK